MYRATLDGKEIKVNVGADGSIWHFVLGRGQVTLANSGDAYLWALSHIVPEDLPHIVKKLRPNTTTDFMRSHLAG